MGRLLFLFFIIVPFVELYLLLAIGRRVGALPTLALLVATGVLGAALARREGRRVLREWQQAMAEGRMPEEGLVQGMLVLVGGLLLVTPGVLTDAMGLLLLLAPTRRWAAGRLRHALERRMRAGTLRVTRIRVGGVGPPPAQPGSPSPPRVQGEVDAEFSEEADPPVRRG